jgi:hypothetical protein
MSNLIKKHFIFSKLSFSVLMLLTTIGCTYQHTYTKGNISIQILNTSDSSLKLLNALENISRNKDLKANYINLGNDRKNSLIEFKTADGSKIFQVIFDIDSNKTGNYLISFYESKEINWHSTLNECFDFLERGFPNAKIKVEVFND